MTLQLVIIEGTLKPYFCHNYIRVTRKLYDEVSWSLLFANNGVLVDETIGGVNVKLKGGKKLWKEEDLK